MTGYEFYQIYSPIKLHFTSTYDFFKYCKKSNTINAKTYEARRDVKVFDAWGIRFFSKKKIGQHCLANFVYNEHGWLYQPFQQAEEIATEWIAKTQNLKGVILNDYDVLASITKEKNLKPEELFVPTKLGNKPPLLQLLLAGYISKEFVIAINDYTNFLNEWTIHYDIDPLISDRLFIIKKYTPFVINTIRSFKLNESRRGFSGEREKGSS